MGVVAVAQGVVRDHGGDLCDVVEQVVCEQVAKRRGELNVGDRFLFDPDAGEDGLVKQSPGLRLGTDVGGLDAVGQAECDLELLESSAVWN